MSYEKGVPEFNSADSIPYASTDISKSIFRSIDVARSETHDVFAARESNYGKFGGSMFVSELVNPFSKNKEDYVFQSSQSVVSCPERPFHLARTHFNLDSSKMSAPKAGRTKFDEIVELINVCLNNFSEYDFSYFHSDAMWKGKYLQGSSCCEIHIHIYAAGAEEPTSFIVEANKVEGDSKPFMSFYRSFHSEIKGVSDNRPQSNLFFDRLPTSNLTPAAFMAGVMPIFNMVKEPFFEARLEASKMLCDLANHREQSLLQLVECRDQVIFSLEQLVDDIFDAVKQHAMCALAAFVQIPGYAESMVGKSNALRVLFTAVDNPTEPAYESIQSRRECARVLCALAKCDHNAVVSALRHVGTNISELNMQRVESIVDARLKMLANTLFDRLRGSSK